MRTGDLCGAFRGSEAVANSDLTYGQLRGPAFVRLFRDVYLPAGMPVTHEIRCQGAALALPGEAVITGRSAATLRGAERLNRLHAAGWEVVFVTAEMLRSPKRMVQTVRAALAVR